jgi:hypothetical protein
VTSASTSFNAHLIAPAIIACISDDEEPFSRGRRLGHECGRQGGGECESADHTNGCHPIVSVESGYEYCALGKGAVTRKKGHIPNREMPGARSNAASNVAIDVTSLFSMTAT